MCNANEHFQIFHGAKIESVFDMYPLVANLRDKARELRCHTPPASGPRLMKRLDETAWVEFYFDRLFYRLTNRLRKQLPTAVDPSTVQELERIVHQHKINKPQLLMVHGTCCNLIRLIERIFEIGGIKPDGSRIDE